MSADKRSCQELVSDRMASRNADLAELMAKANSEDEQTSEEAYDELNNFGLGMSTYILVKIELSTGGPADWIEAKCELAGNNAPRDGAIECAPLSMTYHYADWFDHAEREIPEDSALWQWAHQLIESGVSL